MRIYSGVCIPYLSSVHSFLLETLHIRRKNANAEETKSEENRKKRGGEDQKQKEYILASAFPTYRQSTYPE